METMETTETTETAKSTVSCSKIKFCKYFQLVTDSLFICAGVSALITVIVAKTEGIKDPRLTLGGACLESDTAGFVKVSLSWGVVLGTAVLLTSVVGVYSCLRQDTGLLYCYSMMGYVLALVELLYFLTLYIHLGRATASTKTCFKEVLVRDYSGPYQSDIFNSSGAWDFMHRQYRCCGVDQGEIFNSMVNWDRTWIERYEDPFFNTTLKLDEFKVISVLPYTCCVFKNEEDVHYSPDASVENLRGALQDENCPFTPTTSNSYIQVGCFDLLHLFVSNMTTFAFYVSLIAESFQLTAAVCALYSSRAIMNSRTLEKLMHNRHI